jgi:hypothetical protein
MANGRCRLHGGLSTGPKTEKGLERIRAANLKHGRYTKRAKAARKSNRRICARARSCWPWHVPCTGNHSGSEIPLHLGQRQAGSPSAHYQRPGARAGQHEFGACQPVAPHE